MDLLNDDDDDPDTAAAALRYLTTATLDEFMTSRELEGRTGC
jgi:hypothetical protein